MSHVGMKLAWRSESYNKDLVPTTNNGQLCPTKVASRRGTCLRIASNLASAKPWAALPTDCFGQAQKRM